MEPVIATIGQDLSFLPALMGPGSDGYSAREVVDYLENPEVLVAEFVDAYCAIEGCADADHDGKVDTLEGNAALDRHTDALYRFASRVTGRSGKCLRHASPTPWNMVGIEQIEPCDQQLQYRCIELHCRRGVDFDRIDRFKVGAYHQLMHG